jgi:hypothetical protein
VGVTKAVSFRRADRKAASDSVVCEGAGRGDGDEKARRQGRQGSHLEHDAHNIVEAVELVMAPRARPCVHAQLERSGARRASPPSPMQATSPRPRHQSSAAHCYPSESWT